MVGRWGKPEEIVKGVNPSSLENDDLEFYHDQMHVFWKKIEEGMVFGWIFRDVYLMHKSLVIEMLRRKLEHIHPINELDHIYFVKDVKELTKIVNYVKKKK